MPSMIYSSLGTGKRSFFLSDLKSLVANVGPL